MDADGDGRTIVAERRSHAADRCAAVADSVQLTVDGTPVPFAAERSAFERRWGAEPHRHPPRVATALNRHLVLSFPDKVPDKLKDAVQVA